METQSKKKKATTVYLGNLLNPKSNQIISNSQTLLM